MIKKILSIVLVLIGLFFLLGFFALMNSILWGTIFCGVVSIGCFYLAYRLYPRKVKRDVVIPPPVKKEPVKTVEEVEVIPVEVEKEPYALDSSEFQELTNKTGEYFDKLKQYSLNCNALTENDSENIDKLLLSIYETREKLPQGSNRFSIKLLTDIYLDMSGICNDLNYYIDDKDSIWIEDITLKFSTIGENFSYLSDVISGEMND